MSSEEGESADEAAEADGFLFRPRKAVKQAPDNSIKVWSV
jgi:hypothetical protein